MTYTGNVSTTNHGLTCVQWSNYYSGDAFHFDGKSAVKARNYCRAVGGDRIPWCFTDDPDLPWDYCNIRICRGESYIGVEIATKIVCFLGFPAFRLT